MVFNIEDGGTGVDLELVIEAIRRADPDVVALQEAMGNTARIAQALDWPFASVRTQVIARHPIGDPPAARDGFVFVEIRPGRVVAVASVHLPAEPYGPELAGAGGDPEAVIDLERRIRLPPMASALAPLTALIEAGSPVFLAGDFNAPSHLDWTEATIGLRPHLRAAIDWPVSRAVENAGFRDSWREVHPDPVAEPGLTWWADRPPIDGYQPGPDTPNDRIDMIHAAGPAIATESVIVGEAGHPDAGIGIDPWPSDHRAVVSTFLVSPAAMRLSADATGPNLRAALREPGAAVAVRTSRPTYEVGQPIEVAWQGGPGFRWDWIAVFPAGTEDVRDRHLIWRHTGAVSNGVVRLDGEAAQVDQSSVGGRWPLPAGEYEARYLLDDSSRELGRVTFRIIEPG